jgi:signal transduction histidine kinase
MKTPDGKRPEQRAIVAEVLSLLRHDLRNKLATVRNAAFYLERRAEKTPLWGEPRVPSFFKMIESELEAVESMLTDETMLTRLFDPRPEVVSLLACLDRAREELAPAGLRIENGIEAVPTVRADAEELTLALRCLLANAVEATPSPAPVLIRLRHAEHAWAVEIVDAGPGLMGRSRTEAFDPFVSGKPGHLGLGLNIARRILERWEGGLALDVSPGGGTRATVTLPHPGPEPDP